MKNRKKLLLLVDMTSGKMGDKLSKMVSFTMCFSKKYFDFYAGTQNGGFIELL